MHLPFCFRFSTRNTKHLREFAHVELINSNQNFVRLNELFQETWSTCFPCTAAWKDDVATGFSMLSAQTNLESQCRLWYSFACRSSGEVAWDGRFGLLSALWTHQNRRVHQPLGGLEAITTTNGRAAGCPANHKRKSQLSHLLILPTKAFNL